MHLFRKARSITRSVLIRRLVRLSFWSKSDGCMVVSMRCSGCGGMYDEELQKARSNIIRGEAFMCLSCDDKGGKIRDIRAVLFTFEIV